MKMDYYDNNYDNGLMLRFWMNIIIYDHIIVDYFDDVKY